MLHLAKVTNMNEMHKERRKKMTESILTTDSPQVDGRHNSAGSLYSQGDSSGIPQYLSTAPGGCLIGASPEHGQCV